MFSLNPLLLTDFYKVLHHEQYPKGTSLVFSNFTPRKSRMIGINHSVFFGLSYFMGEYLDKFHHNFFSIKKDLIMGQYRHTMKEAIGRNDFDHIADLHDVGFLPIKIYALPEGAVVPCGVPAMVIYNSHPKFYWLTNALETLLSCTLWGACTSATIAREYRIILDRYAALTSDIPEFVDYQAHDFSFRGMFGVEAAMISGGAHLQYFKGTDCIPAIYFQNEYYDKPMSCGSSVAATEHSVMCAGGEANELDTYRRLINDVYPSGVVAIVSDTWDFWKVIDEYLPLLKDDIMRRDGSVVIRPDSGDPVEIICGADSTHSHRTTTQEKGLIQRLWEIFGGTINSKGYRQLDPHIGAIYGDSITLDRCKEICERLKEEGFASTNIVFGIGSYTYQYNTRDTLGWAMKSTYAEINGNGVELFKNPKTDDGTKKSHKGLLKVIKENGEYKVLQGVSWEEFHADDNELKLRFNGV